MRANRDGFHPDYAGTTALLIATRDPRGALTGRKTVLRTIIASLDRLGCRVIVCHFGPGESGSLDSGLNARFIPLPMPGMAEIGRSFAAGFVPGRRSLNECLYESRKARNLLGKVVLDERVDVVVTDMIRTASYGARLEIPWIADLDDLLSLRYSRMAADPRSIGDCEGMLGYRDSRILRMLCRLSSPLRRRMLLRESRILARREVDIVRSAPSTTLVSAAEAEILSERSGRPIHATPMAIHGPSTMRPVRERERDLVFVGGFDYLPNRLSVEDFDRVARTELERAGLTDVVLDVIGKVSPEQRSLLSDKIHFVGYVDDLDEALQTYRAMIVPRGLRGGVKTKIIHAAVNGTVVLADPESVEGMGMTPGRDVLLWETPTELVSHLARLGARDPELEEIARAARVWADRSFSEKTLTRLWADHLGRVLELRTA